MFHIPNGVPHIHAATIISLLFVRSSAGTVFFPRLTALYFLAYHCYFYYYPRGFFGLAAAASFLLLLHAMLYSITALEVPALSRYVYITAALLIIA
jgi:hypothetical protein